MTHDVELELHNRPNDGTAVALVARRLQICLFEVRTGRVHDHALGYQPDSSLTVAPPGSLAWASHAEQVWNKFEWAERHGAAPILFELRTPVPHALSKVEVHDFARSLAGFVARDLGVPVTLALIDGNAPWPMRDSAGHQVRLCFPTRMLALNDQSNAILDRSGEPSGFASRLSMVGNPHLAKMFTQRVTEEVGRLRRGLPTNGSTQPPATRGSARSASLAADGHDLFADLIDLSVPRTAPTENPETHPLLARLRREAPRGMTLPDLRDFEIAMGFARTVEEILGDVISHEKVDKSLRDKLARTTTAMLDHMHHLDRARDYRSQTKRELEELQARKGSLMTLLRGRMELASLARERKAVELRRAREHVEELKAAIGRLRSQERRLKADCAVSSGVLKTARLELQGAVRGLHGADPRLLTHMVAICSGPERDCMRAAVASVVPTPAVPEGGEATDEGGHTGPPVKVSRAAKPR
ncbi:hypothetical protein KPL74_09015 [Bacillus sp. NP157]|nr:hypothetical protein KPL74_09015 [Bacillus sp. NP157]